MHQSVAISAEIGHGGFEKQLVDYCYYNGFCEMEKFNMLNKTIEDSEPVCNLLYGDEWKKMNFEKLSKKKATEQNLKTLLAWNSCATGTFWCDVQLCQTQVCGVAYFDRHTQGYRKAKAEAEAAAKAKA